VIFVKKAKQVLNEPLTSGKIVPKVMYKLNLDIVGPLVLSSDPRGSRVKMRYILTLIDSFSKFLITIPLPNVTAPTVCQAIVLDLISVHGPPNCIASDQGSQFMSEVFYEMAKTFHIKHITTVPYHPAANGQIERVHKDLKASLSAYTDRYGQNWSNYLSLITWSHNSQIHRSTGYSPYYLVFGRQPQFPTDLGLNIYLGNKNNTNFGEDLRLRLKVACEHAMENINKAQEVQKRDYDLAKHVKLHDITPNDLVLWYRDVVPIEERHKFSKHWKGPFHVSFIDPPNITLLDNDGRPFITHLDKIKKYHPEEPLPMRPKDVPYRGVLNIPLENNDQNEKGNEIVKDNQKNINIDQVIEETIVHPDRNIDEELTDEKRYNLRARRKK
jgi:hypothetical protein